MTKKITNSIFIILVICSLVFLSMINNCTSITSKKLKKKSNGVHDIDFLEKAITSDVAGEISVSFLKKSKSRTRLGIKDANGNENNVVVDKVVHDEDDGSKHAKIVETINGIPIWGENIIVHINENGEVYKKDEDAEQREVLINTVPKIQKDEAIKCAEKSSNPDGSLNVKLVSAELVILPLDGKDNLVYAVDLDLKQNSTPKDPIIFISALNCEKIFEIENLQGQVKVSSSNDSFTLLNRFNRHDGTSASNDVDVEACYQNTKKVEKMLSEYFNRNSWNNNGAEYLVHANYGYRYNNAFWSPNSSALVFGDGDGTQFKQFCKDLHVVGHEIGHAIVSSDSGLVYKNESGALNESFADCFGSGVYWYQSKQLSSGTFLIGETSYTPGVDGDGLRNMENPTVDGNSRDCYSLRFTESWDNGGVHFNSGIPNLAFAKLVKGGTHPRPNECKTNVTAIAIGMEKALKILYRAQKLYYTSSTTFEQARKHWEQAAKDLYGQDEITAVSKAWALVGVGSDTTSSGGSDSSSGNSYNTRYIQLQAPNSGDHNLNISQIACYDDNGVNVAKGKAASSNSPSHGTLPSQVVDGVLKTKNHPESFHSTHSTGDWLKIDLGQDYKVSRCVIYNRNDCCQHRVKGMDLTLRNQANQIIASHTIESEEKVINISFKSDRFVKITMPSSGDHNINLSQIACFNESGVNLTKGKTATSSTASHGTTPSQVVDGNMSPKNHPQSFHSASNVGDWIKVDMGGSFDVKRCTIVNRNDCCQHRIKGAKLEILNSSGVSVKSHVISSEDKVIDVSFSKIKYIKLKAPSSGDKFLQISQLACYNLSGENVTQGKPVTASSKHDAIVTVQTITDGILQNKPHPQSYHSKYAVNDEIIIDMQSKHMISKCVYYNRKECCQSRIVGAKLSLLDENKNEVADYTFTTSDLKIDIPF